MTLYDLQYIMVAADDQFVRVYNLNGGDCETIYDGLLSDIPYSLEDIEISSIDNVYGDCNYIGINIDFDGEDCEEEEDEDDYI